jgi:hypothetical protein
MVIHYNVPDVLVEAVKVVDGRSYGCVSCGMAGDWYGVDTVIFAPDFQFFTPRILYLVTAKF